MEINIIRRKPGTRAELGREVVSLDNTPTTVRDLLECLTHIGLAKAQQAKPDIPLTKTEETDQANLGRIRFGEKYGTNTDTIEHAIAVMTQDFTDGIFRLFIDGEEATDLDACIALQDQSEITLLKLVMLTGRLW